ncbi:amidohydrolase family protein [Clostridium tagluense]|uniref:N-acyl-D-amino-acid deacylase family protein n=1 Tax=Clostridium tagluense TaxID=360422 RepID=UPI001CF44566|nr:amidohydrolase family protein [Clostridium tagluense]MCB2310962.1 amidohydrolase family protein [Clostridium tagluense]MCB2315816.1 amidohydrolase family protein [Clostridium tagluense]MCB2320540.1 amidohydrolase family protein [Clostridium tagluense]MCB2325555.1 amidohydrolase family protein [Clostridium tagluense]MCB2330408.1 amidohydrolase family protein [Clostridium tagluense]
MLDIIIKNGCIVDGTGNASYKGNLGIKDGKIIKIKNNIDEQALEIIDANGLVVCPGFIDVHSHNDLVPFMDEKIQNLKLMQGVTTELVGQCGLGVVPCIEKENNIWKNYIRGVVGAPSLNWSFSNLYDYIRQISSIELKNNFTILISHGAIKSSVMNFDSRIATKEEINTMCNIAEDAMKAGAFGMSIGLQYLPGIFSTKDELIAICSVIAKYDGIVMVHLRNHDDTITSALEEIIYIAKQSKVRLHISHLRSYNSKDLGCDAKKLISYVDSAVANGIKITFDEHLYLSGSTLMTQLLPPWITAGGSEEMGKRLKDKKVVLKLKEELKSPKTHYSGWDNYSLITGWDGILITSVKEKENLKYVGKTVGNIAKDLGIAPIDFALQLLMEEKFGVAVVTLNVFSEEDTIKLINHPLQMVGSDSIPGGNPHPRLYGNYPLFIGKFVRDKKALSLETAIYKISYLPAKTLGLKNIGEIAVGKTADIVLFDLNEIKGFENYFKPTTAPVGIKFVVLNGKIAVKNSIVCKCGYGKVYNFL